jgi:cytochrome subunit of sulfide dehydrogenase
MKARLLLLLACMAPAAQAGEHTRTLAASCSACHGTNGNSVGGTPVLAGLDRAYFVTQMQAFLVGERASTVMHHHAKGLTEEEIGLLAGYFSAQPRTAASAPLPLKGFE